MRIPLLSLHSCNLVQQVHETHRRLHSVTCRVSLTLSRLLLPFLRALQGCVRCNRKRSAAHSMDWWVSDLSAVLLLALMPGRMLQREFPSGGDFEGYSALYPCPADGQCWFCPSLSRRSVLSFAVALGVGVGYSAEAQQCPLHEIYHSSLSFSSSLWRTSINLQRSIPVYCNL